MELDLPAIGSADWGPKVNAAFAEVQENVNQIEADLPTTSTRLVSNLVQSGTSTWSNTANMSVPIFTAPFPLTVTSVTMEVWSSASNTPLSNTSYYLVEIRKHSADNSAVTTISQKSTRIDGIASPGGPANNGVPVGQAITARTPWKFDAEGFTFPDLDTDETLSFNTFPVSSPTAWSGPVIVTVGYVPST